MAFRYIAIVDHVIAPFDPVKVRHALAKRDKPVSAGLNIPTAEIANAPHAAFLLLRERREGY